MILLILPFLVLKFGRDIQMILGQLEQWELHRWWRTSHSICCNNIHLRFLYSDAVWALKPCFLTCLLVKGEISILTIKRHILRLVTQGLFSDIRLFVKFDRGSILLVICIRFIGVSKSALQSFLKLTGVV